MNEKYSCKIKYGVPQFLKNGEIMSNKDVLNELEIKQMLLKQWISECERLEEKNNQLEQENQKLDEKVCSLTMDLVKTKSYKQLEKENGRLKHKLVECRRALRELKNNE